MIRKKSIPIDAKMEQMMLIVIQYIKNSLPLNKEDIIKLNINKNNIPSYSATIKNLNVYSNMTNNCQLMSMGNFQCIFDILKISLCYCSKTMDKYDYINNNEFIEYIKEHYSFLENFFVSDPNNDQMIIFNIDPIFKYKIYLYYINILNNNSTLLKKKILLIDLKKEKHDIFMSSLLKDFIIVSTPYTSTNGSDMVLTLINNYNFCCKYVPWFNNNDYSNEDYRKIKEYINLIESL